MRVLLEMAGFLLSLYLAAGLSGTTKDYLAPAMGAPLAVFAYSLMMIPLSALAEACLTRRLPVLIPPLMFAMVNLSYWWSLLLTKLGFGDHFSRLGTPRDLIGVVLWLPAVGLAFFFAHRIADLVERKRKMRKETSDSRTDRSGNGPQQSSTHD